MYHFLTTVQNKIDHNPPPLSQPNKTINNAKKYKKKKN